ncbi:autophagy protein atg9, partial [Balamuthia mandrillaris]
QKTARSLQWRFRLLGLVSLILSPFVLVFLLAYFFFKYGEELRNRPSFTLASRQWSRLARWKFRCFNELPHALETRLNASHTAANEYVDQFQSNILMICARFVAFVLGAFVAVLIVIAVVDDEILTESQIGGKSLLWYLGISGSVLAVTRALIPREGQVFNPKAKLDEVVCHTYYKPDTWIGEEHMWWVRDELVELYEYKIMAFLRELVSILVAPFILFFTLGSSAVSQDIVNFFQHFTEYVEGVGNMCSCANFETGFAKHGDHNWGSPAALTLNKFVKTSQGKMEKSFMDFVTTYPSYRPSEQGADILVKLSKHREAVLRSKAEAHLESSGFIDTNMFASKPGTSNSAGPSSAPWRGTAAVSSSLRFSEPPSLLMQSFHEALMTSGANIFDGLGNREGSDKSDDELSAGPSSSPTGL